MMISKRMTFCLEWGWDCWLALIRLLCNVICLIEICAICFWKCLVYILKYSTVCTICSKCVLHACYYFIWDSTVCTIFSKCVLCACYYFIWDSTVCAIFSKYVLYAVSYVLGYFILGNSKPLSCGVWTGTNLWCNIL